MELKMPALSPTMEKGTLARWLVREGDIVDPDSLTWECDVKTCEHCRAFYTTWKQKYKEQEERRNEPR